MVYEKKPGDVVIFYNKSESPNAPKYKGHVLGLNGEELEIALWEKFSNKDGNMFFTGKISVPIKRNENKPYVKPSTPSNEDDDLPF